MSKAPTYPAMLIIKGRLCVVVGGGAVAERKAMCLVRSGAKVRLVSPDVTRKLAAAAKSGKLTHLARRFRPSDLKGAFITVAATDDAALNAKIAESAPMLVNVADNPALCNFILPSTIRRGELTIAISTSGASPAAARAIKQELEGRFGPAVSDFLRDLATMRSRAKREIGDPAERRRHLKAAGSRAALRRHLKARGEDSGGCTL